MNASNHGGNPTDKMIEALNEVSASFRQRIRLAEQQAEISMEELVRTFTAPKTPTPKPSPVKVIAPTKRGTVFYPDSLFLNALTSDWQSATALHRKLRASGVSKGSIYARFQRLADDPKSKVEGSDYNYRLRAPVAVKPAPAAPSKPDARPVRRKRSAALHSGGRKVTRLTPTKTEPVEVREFWVNGVCLVLTIG